MISINNERSVVPRALRLGLLMLKSLLLAGLLSLSDPSASPVLPAAPARLLRASTSSPLLVGALLRAMLLPSSHLGDSGTKLCSSSISTPGTAPKAWMYCQPCST